VQHIEIFGEMLALVIDRTVPIQAEGVQTVQYRIGGAGNVTRRVEIIYT